MLYLQVVIPAFNEEQVLPLCLAALRVAAARASDSLTLLHVLVSDGDSVDGTCRLAEDNGCVVVRRDQQAGGRGPALNRAIDKILEGEEESRRKTTTKNDPPPPPAAAAPAPAPAAAAAPAPAPAPAPAVRAAATDLILFLHADCILGPDSLLALATLFSESPKKKTPPVSASVFHPQFLLPPSAPFSRRLFFSVCSSWCSLGVGLFRTFGDQGICVRPSLLSSGRRFPPWSLFEDVAFLSGLRDERGDVGPIRQVPRGTFGEGATIGINTRRFDKVGRWTYAARCAKLIIMWKAGVRPEKLAELYGR